MLIGKHRAVVELGALIQVDAQHVRRVTLVQILNCVLDVLRPIIEMRWEGFVAARVGVIEDDKLVSLGEAGHRSKRDFFGQRHRKVISVEVHRFGQVVLPARTRWAVCLAAGPA